MIRGKTLTAIIPVRGGSKRMAGKNMRKIGRDSLLERAIKLARTASGIDRILVSTDDPKMQDVAQAYGAAAPGLRPAELAGDDASTVDVVAHLIEEAGIDDGALLLLQTISPLRTTADLAAVLDLFEETRTADAVVSLCRQEGAHPEKAQKIDGQYVASYMGTESQRPEQTLPHAFVLNGAFYLVDRGVFLSTRSFLPTRTVAYLMPPERSINLDTETDWQILDAMLAKNYWTIEEYD